MSRIIIIVVALVIVIGIGAGIWWFENGGQDAQDNGSNDDGVDNNASDNTDINQTCKK